MPNYRIEFFELAMDATAEFSTPFDLLKSLTKRSKAGDVLCVSVGDYMREFWNLRESGTAIRGSFRKFRMSDLPEIGSVGGVSQAISLAENQGLVEKNYFTLYRSQSVLLWHTNGHANTPTQFAKALSVFTETNQNAIPIISKDAIKRLMKGDVELRKIEISVPRPKNPDFYFEEDFNRQLVATLAAADGDRIRVSISTNTRTNESPTLKSKIKLAIRELVASGAATVARTEVVEDGVEHPIDLIADRLMSFKEIDHDGRYPSEKEIFSAFDDARQEQREALDAVFGRTGGGAIR